MKFSILLALALTYSTLTSAQAPGDFHAKNAQEAEQLTKQFSTLTPDSSCTDGQQACVNKQFAQCVGGKFQLTQCSGGTECAVLPLVNKAGTSITCDTPADQKARIAAALGQNSPPAGDNTNNSTNGSPSPQKSAVKGKGKKGKGKSKGKANNSANVSPPSANNGTDVNSPSTNNSTNGTQSSGEKVKGKKGKNHKGVNQGQNNNGTLPQQNLQAAPPANNSNGDFHKQNAADAESLQQKFSSLTPNSPCTNGQQACVNKQFAQCVNNKFALTPCGSGLECAALPLVLKPGTSIACTTEADRLARINASKSAKK